MSYLDWPQEADVLLVCEGFGVTSLPAGFDVGTEVGAAVGRFERGLGFSPALAGSAFVTREMFLDHGSTGVFSLGVPMVEIDLVARDGVELVLDQEWFFEGVQAPWRSIRLSSFGGCRISVRGRIGAFDEVPVDVWSAVRDLVASDVLERSFAESADREYREIRQDSVTLKMGDSGRSAAVLAMRSRAESVLDSWVGFGLGVS